MIQRFQIEDLVIQDISGVVFRALDTETNQTVAVRRFFPFGANGGGLRDDEQTAYNIAIGRLAGIRHPALRAVICGGCDPVDGMPYIATEWVEGTRLQAFVERGPLSQAEATNLLTRALEVCELLSQVLAEEAVWVETDLQAIVVGAEATGRGVTFSIAPLKWLGTNDGQRGLESLITLTENIMDWRGQVVGDQTGTGIGVWLKWFRGAARTTTLHEAREMLAAAIGVEPPIPAKNLVRLATRPVVVGKKKKKKSPFTNLIVGTVALISFAAGGLGLIQWRNSKLEGALSESPSAAALDIAGTEAPSPPVIAPAPTGPVRATAVEDPAAPPTILSETPAGKATRRAAELSAVAKKATEESESKAASLKAEIATRGGVFTPKDHELLVAQDDKTVTVEGTFAEIGYSKSRKTMYLLFSKNASVSETRGSVVIKDGHADLTEPKLAPLVGKKIRLHGKVQVERIINRPVIVIENRTAIQEVK